MTLRNGESRGDLVREADAARAKLLRAVGELDRRGHRAFDVRAQWQSRPLTLLAEGGLVCLTLGVSTSVLREHILQAPLRRRRARWRLARSVWFYPSRELRARRNPLAIEMLRSASIALVAAAVVGVARRLFPGPRRLADSPLPSRAS
ncbi:MAG: hypothetical protein ACREJ3_09705 [Polyangiaceae bacterium]